MRRPATSSKPLLAGDRYIITHGDLVGALQTRYDALRNAAEAAEAAEAARDA